MEYKFVDENFDAKNLDVIANTDLGDCDDWVDKFTKIINGGFESIISKGKKSIGIDIGSFKTELLSVTYIYSETDQFIINFNKKNNSLNDFSFYFINFLMPKKLYYEKMYEAFEDSLPIDLAKNLEQSENIQDSKTPKFEKETDDLTYKSKDAKLEAELKKQIKDELKYYYDNDFIYDEDDIEVQLTSNIKAQSIIKGRKSSPELHIVSEEEREMRIFDVFYNEVHKEAEGKDFYTCYWGFVKKRYGEEKLKDSPYSMLYKPAGVSKQEFSLILKKKTPSRRIVAALALGLRLTLPEIEILYKSAGYSFNLNDKIDITVKFCVKYNYDMGLANRFSYEKFNIMPFGTISSDKKEKND